ncbi:hypothetical protein U1Q18_015744 [Sarracenia purpurea var. burkii]
MGSSALNPGSTSIQIRHRQIRHRVPSQIRRRGIRPRHCARPQGRCNSHPQSSIPGPLGV